MSSDLPWPATGDRAFIDGSGEFAFYLRNIFPDYPYRADAFKAAAELLLDAHFKGETRFNRDAIFFPIAYLYRHAFELRMKDIISAGHQLNLYKTGELPASLRTHNLHRLWQLARLAIIRRWKDSAEVAAAGAFIHELHEADPNGELFRYDPDHPSSRNPALPDQVSPENMHAKMDAIYSFLDSTASGLETDYGNQRSSQR